jgi:hypothetical protein
MAEQADTGNLPASVQMQPPADPPEELQMFVADGVAVIDRQFQPGGNALGDSSGKVVAVQLLPEEPELIFPSNYR